MTPKRRRLAGVLCMVLALGAAAALVLTALEDSVVFFRSPTEIVAMGGPAGGGRMRVGGLVKEGSVRRDGASVTFVVTDLRSEVLVRFTGLLPDLFREGQGVVAEGRLAADGGFDADGVLAKHDETYMPPEVAEALRRSGQWMPAGGPP